METPINNIYPALAIKLAPPSSSEISVAELLVERVGKKYLVRFSGWGENISEAWVEYSRDNLDWERMSKFIRHQPFMFTIPAEKYPQPGSFLRGAVRDALGTIAYSEVYAIPYAPH